MKFIKLSALLSAVAVSFAMSSAQAAPIIGAMSFADGLSTFGTTTSIVSLLTAIDDDGSAVTGADAVFGCSGAFVCGAPGPFAVDFTIAAGDQIIYNYGIYTFHLTSLTTGPSAAPAFGCGSLGCADGLTFTGQGYVTAAGFDDTFTTIAFTANGACNKAAGAAECGSNVTASWSSSVSATGIVRQQVPEPTTTALLGLGLLALGFSVRRRRQ